MVVGSFLRADSSFASLTFPPNKLENDATSGRKFHVDIDSLEADEDFTGLTE